MLIVKNIKNNTMYNMQELCLHFVELILTKLVFSIFSSYSPISHVLSHSHSQLLGFQINPLSHIPLLTNSLHSHGNLLLFQVFIITNTCI